MRDLEKLAIAALASLVTHAALGAALEQLPEQNIQAQRQLHITVVAPPKPPDEPPPPPEPPKPPESPKPQPRPVEHPTQPQHVSQPATHRPEPPPPTPTTAPASSADTGEQIYDGGELGGVSSPGGPEIHGGAGGGPTPPAGSAAPARAPTPKPPDPIPDYEASTPPLPQGRCAGKYTEDAKLAGVEGVVLLDIVVGEDGSVRDVSITKHLGHGLDEAAAAALRACKFTPGEQGGKAVAVKIRGFKARFVLSEAP